MADKLLPLIRLGPFKGLDATTSGPYTEPTRAYATANVDIRRQPGGFTTARGRQELVTLSGDGEVSSLTELVATQGLRYLFASLSSGEVSYVNLGDLTTGAVLTNGQSFTQAVQYGPSLFTNVGQQFSQGQLSSPRAMKWQYAVSDTGFVPTVGAHAHSAIGMAQQTYTYLFTVGIRLPTRTYAFDEWGQESTPIGFVLSSSGIATYQYQVTVPDANTDVLISGNNTNAWSGTLFDGTQWGVNIYRQSSNQPIFFLCASAFWQTGDSWGQLVNGTAFEDSQTDLSLQGNIQMFYNQDPPPLSTTNPGVVMVHKERTWAFVIVENSDTFNQPQCQLWYSAYGVPWQFDAQNQVLLVGNDGTPDLSTGSFGDIPMAAVSLASVGVLLKSRTLWMLTGDDQNSFLVRKVGEYGCVSQASVTVIQGIVYWLTEEGVFSFDGANAPQYLSDNIRNEIDALPLLDWQNAVGWFSERTYFLSFPHIVGTDTITFGGRTQGSNNGTPSVSYSASPQRQTTTLTTESATVTESCHDVQHRPTPNPDTWFDTWLCTITGQTNAVWATTANVAPTTSGTQLDFYTTSVINDMTNPSTLTLKNPANTVVATWTNIVSGQHYTYFDAAAATGTYTWTLSVGRIGSGGDDSGTYSIAVSPTITLTIPGNTGSTTDGVKTTLQTRPAAAAPVSVSTALSCILSTVEAPADANGITSYSVQLFDPSNVLLQTWTGITSDTTLTYETSSAVGGIYTWTAWPTATSLNVGSSVYQCSAVITLTWTETAVETTYRGGVTYGYHLPSKEWFKYSFSTNAAFARTAEPSAAATDTVLNEVYGAREGTCIIDAWAVDSGDLDSPVMGTWTSPETDSQGYGVEKTYKTIELTAPVQPGAYATVVLVIDPGFIGGPNKTFSWTIDLGKQATSVWEVPNNESNSNLGFTAQVTVSAASYLPVGGTTYVPVYIYGLTVFGTGERSQVPWDNGAVV